MVGRRPGLAVTLPHLHSTVLYCMPTTHCPDQYWTGIHWNTMYFTAIHCPGFITLHFNIVAFISMHCTLLRCTTVYCTALHCTWLHLISLYYTTLHFDGHKCTVLYPFHCNALHCTALNSIVHVQPGTGPCTAAVKREAQIFGPRAQKLCVRRPWLTEVALIA